MPRHRSLRTRSLQPRTQTNRRRHMGRNHPNLQRATRRPKHAALGHHMKKKTHSLYGTQEWKRLRLQVLKEGNYICHWCGGKATQADHLIERDRDPDLQLERSNLVPACQPCNSRRGSLYQAKTRQERAARNGGHGYSMQWPIPCLRCGETFTPDWRNTKRGQGKYCSRECAFPKKPRWEYIVTW